MEGGIQGRALSEIAAACKGALRGDDAQVTRPASLGQAGESEITFLADPKDAGKVGEAAAVVCSEALELDCPQIIVESPRVAWAAVLGLWERPAQPMEEGVHSEAQIGEGVQIHPGAKIYERTVIGDGCVIGPNAVILPDVRIGSGCRIGPNAVIGSEGFGYAWDGKQHVRIPQIGGVVIGDQVEIGAQTCIDRGTVGDTVIEPGVKIDNLCQIAHNVRIGAFSVLAAQVGIAGSAIIGRGCLLGGKSGVSDHVELADGVMLGGNSAALRSLREPGEYLGSPAAPKAQMGRALMIVPKLPDLIKRVRELEKK